MTKLILLEKNDNWWVKTDKKEDIYQIAKYKLTDVVLKQDNLF